MSIFAIFFSAWDVYFEFKSAEVHGTLFHSQMDGNEIQISLVNETHLRITYGYGPGFDVVIKSDKSLNDRQWHTLNVEWNLKELSVYLDKEVLTKPIKHSRLLKLAPKVYLGANRQFQKEGYRGCLRSFWIQGQKVDLAGSFKKDTRGVRQGCVGSCDSQPCLNGGLCLEHYNDFTCNCTATAFKGRSCIEDVSVHFNGSQSIKANLSSPLVTQDRLRVHLAFAFEGYAPEDNYLFQAISSRQDRSLTVILNSKTQLTVHLDEQKFIYEPTLSALDLHVLRIGMYSVANLYLFYFVVIK